MLRSVKFIQSYITLNDIWGGGWMSFSLKVV